MTASAILVRFALLAVFSVAFVAANDCPYYEPLSLLYTSTGGPNWTQAYGWNTNSCPCPTDGTREWGGLVCSNGILKGFILGGNNLVGTIPEGIFSVLTNVTSLMFNDNNLSGTLPNDISALKDLTNIQFQSNKLTGGIDFLTGLTKLTEINFSFNQMDGTLPTFEAMTALQTLFMAQNQLQGTIPASLFDIKSLSTISLYGNKLSGTIPELSSKVSLNINLLFLRGNQLTGTIPAWISTQNCPKISSLDLSANQFEGPFPLFTAPNSLHYFNVSHNAINQPLPGTFSTPIVIYFDISFNQITGSLPSFLAAFTAPFIVSLSHNNFTGDIPDSYSVFNNFTMMGSLDLSSNKLTGKVPNFWNKSPQYNLNISNNLFQCDLPDWCSAESDGGNGMCAPCQGGSGGLSGWDITLIVLGSLLGAAIILAVIAAVAFFLYKRLRHSHDLEGISS